MAAPKKAARPLAIEKPVFRRYVIPMVILFLFIGLYMVLRTRAAVCDPCQVTGGLKIFDAVGSRTRGSDWVGEPEVLPGLPSNLTSPINYADGDAYIRFEVLEKPSNLNTVVIVCANDQYFNERCSYKGTEYKLMFTTTGVIYANLGKPKEWQQVSNGQYNFDQPLYHPYLQFVDKEHLDDVIAGGADPNDLEFGQEATSVLNGFYYNQSALSQHLPIKVDAELYFTLPNTMFDPPDSWNCPPTVCPGVATSTPTATLTPTATPTPTPTDTPTPTPTTSPTPSGENPDLNNDGSVGVLDLAILIKNYKKTGATAAEGDINHDGTVSITDLSKLVSAWGT